MKVITTRVVDGRIELDAPLEDGTAIAILAAEDERFELSPAQEEELSSALREIRAGDFIDGRQLVAELKASKP